VAIGNGVARRRVPRCRSSCGEGMRGVLRVRREAEVGLAVGGCRVRRAVAGRRHGLRVAAVAGPAAGHDSVAGHREQ